MIYYIMTVFRTAALAGFKESRRLIKQRYEK